ISDVGLENCDVRAERRKCLADILEIRIFLPAPSYQDEVFDVALCYQPFGDFDPKRTKPSGDEIGSLEIGRSYRSLGSDCTNHACHESSGLPYRDLILPIAVENFAQQCGSVIRRQGVRA